MESPDLNHPLSCHVASCPPVTTLAVAASSLSDVDIESEAYRWLGSLRFTVGTLVRITKLKHYSGRISFLPATAAIEGEVSEVFNKLLFDRVRIC